MPKLDLTADYTLGPDVVIRFDLLPNDLAAQWCPAEQVLLVARNLTGHELAVTLLHEIGHMLCGDHVDVPDREHALIEQWAVHSANLLDIVRPGRRAMPDYG